MRSRTLYVWKMKTMWYRCLRITVVFAVAFFLSVELSADTVIRKDGVREKGLILDEYKDRIVFSTVEGERTILKADIRSVVYEDEKRALMQKAKNLLKRRLYVKSYYAYEKVIALDPDSTEAKERLEYLRGYLETKIRNNVIDSIAQKNIRIKNEADRSPVEKVEQDMGIVLASDGRYVYITDIVNKKVKEAEQKLQPGDRVISVWGELTAFMDPEDVAMLFLSPGEIRVGVERRVEPQLLTAKRYFFGILRNRYKKIIGANLSFKKDGLRVLKIDPNGPFGQVGIQNDDILWRMNGKNTRYMPMSMVADVCIENQGKQIEVIIRSEVTLWREE